MQYSWGGNVSIQLIREVAENIAGHGKVIMNHAAAEKSASPTATWSKCARRSTTPKGRVMRCEGIRPDTLLMIGPVRSMGDAVCQGFHAPSINALMPMLLDLTDATGSERRPGQGQGDAAKGAQ